MIWEIQILQDFMCKACMIITLLNVTKRNISIEFIGLTSINAVMDLGLLSKVSSRDIT